MKFVSGFCFLALLLSSAVALCAAPPTDAQKAKDATIVQTLLRLKGFDFSSRPELKAAVARHLQTHKGTERYLELVEKLDVRDAGDELLQMALEDPQGNLGVNAARLLLKFDQLPKLQKAIQSTDDRQAAAAVTVLGYVGGKQVVPMIQPLVTDTKRGLAVRSAAVVTLGRYLDGQRTLLKLAQEKKLPADLNFSTANVLYASADASIRREVAKHLKLPAVAGSKPLPPVATLIKQTGDASRGLAMFKEKATCAKCHKVRGQGKEVGPDLSEIGSKLSKEAMYVSILDPNAGISHNYETHALFLENGTIVTGILVSQTDQSATIKTAEAILRTIPKEEIEEIVKQKVSLMPSDLQKNLTAQDLVDVVEYLTTLKKTEK